MKTIITTLNSKYIHTSLALRLLYVASYHRFDVDFKEYTIKDSLEHIVDDLLKRNCDIIAFSCYIWNIEYIEKIDIKLPEIDLDHNILVFKKVKNTPSKYPRKAGKVTKNPIK